MSAPFAVPSCSVSPAGGGVCSYTNGTTGSIIQSAFEEAWQNYIYTATPAAGYEFDHWEFTRTWDEYNQQPRQEPTYGSPANPYTSNGASDAGSAAWYEYGGEWAGLPGYKGHVASISVLAVFRAIPQHTHLLVNSATVVNPVVPVYDPTSDLLVADF